MARAARLALALLCSLPMLARPLQWRLKQLSPRQQTRKTTLLRAEPPFINDNQMLQLALQTIFNVTKSLSPPSMSAATATALREAAAAALGGGGERSSNGDEPRSSDEPSSSAVVASEDADSAMVVEKTPAPLPVDMGPLNAIFAETMTKVVADMDVSNLALERLSGVLDQALKDATRNPLEAARVVLSTMATGTQVAIWQPSAQDERDVTALLKDGYFSDGANNIFGADVKVAPLNFDASGSSSLEWLRRAVFASRLASAAYSNLEAPAAIRELNCSRVASGMTHDVAWHVTDSVCDGVLERHVVLRGFDASDDRGDRPGLVGKVLAAAPRRIPFKAADTTAWSDKNNPPSTTTETKKKNNKFVPGVVAHRGFLFIAEALLLDLEPFLDVADCHRLVLCGHSIGGSLATLLTVLLNLRSGLRAPDEVFVFAALPCLRLSDDDDEEQAAPDVILDYDYLSNKPEVEGRPEAAALEPFVSFLRGDDGAKKQELPAPSTVLGTLGLSEESIHAFTQPWDPLVRWYSADDPCFPLVADLGDDGFTLYASGPRRTLRPLLRSVLQTAQEWPSIRDVYRSESAQNYSATGSQFLILPPTSRYVSDRVIALAFDVPDPQLLCSVATDDFAIALNRAFPLDSFSISLIPTALRSLVHHFHNAYSDPLLQLLKLEEEAAAQQQQLLLRRSSRIYRREEDDAQQPQQPASQTKRTKALVADDQKNTTPAVV